MNQNDSRRPVVAPLLRLVAALCLCATMNAWAQMPSPHIRLPYGALEGRPITVEMWSGCPALIFETDFHDVQVDGQQLVAHASGHGGVWPLCPPGSGWWQAFHLDPLPAGEYDLTVYADILDDETDEVRYSYPYGNLFLRVEVAGTPIPLNDPLLATVPATSGWHLLMMACAILLAAVTARRRNG